MRLDGTRQERAWGGGDVSVSTAKVLCLPLPGPNEIYVGSERFGSLVSHPYPHYPSSPEVGLVSSYGLTRTLDVYRVNLCTH